MRSKPGPDEEQTGKSKFKSMNNMKEENNVLQKKCSYCGSTRFEEDEDIVKCLDCGMGKYKKDRHKQAK